MMIALGIALGIGIALLFFVFRRLAPMALKALSMVALLLATIGTAGLSLISVLAMKSGGDGFMAGATGLFFVVAGFLTLGAASTLVAAMQARPLGESWGTVFVTAMPEVILVLVAAFLVNSLVIESSQRRFTDTWWKEEQTRRMRVETLKNDIPPQYRFVEPYMLEQNENERHELSKVGMKGPRMVPEDVEAKLRRYWAESSKPQVAPVQNSYASFNNMRRDFFVSLGLAWLLGVISMARLFATRSPSQNAMS